MELRNQYYPLDWEILVESAIGEESELNREMLLKSTDISKSTRFHGNEQNKRPALKVAVPGSKLYPKLMSVMPPTLPDAPKPGDTEDKAAPVSGKPYKVSYFLSGWLEGKPV